MHEPWIDVSEESQARNIGIASARTEVTGGCLAKILEGGNCHGMGHGVPVINATVKAAARIRFKTEFSVVVSTD